jgi:hypothetical protein
VGELQRLKNHQHWSRRKWKTIQARFRRAFEAEFVSVFGANDNYRAGWEALCELLDVDPVPPSVTQCKKVVCLPFSFFCLFFSLFFFSVTGN